MAMSASGRTAAGGSGKACARLGDPTSHGGVIGPSVAVNSVIVGGQPVATLGDPHICPEAGGSGESASGHIVRASTSVVVGGRPVARVGDDIDCRCSRDRGVIAPPGSADVFFGD